MFQFKKKKKKKKDPDPTISAVTNIHTRFYIQIREYPSTRILAAALVGGPEAISVPLTMRGAVCGPEAFFVPWTKPIYKMTTGMQEDPIHQDTVFPKQKTKKHKDDKSQSLKVRRKLNLEECSDESKGAEKKHRSTKLETEHKPTKHKISAEDGKKKQSNKLKLSEKSDNDSAPDNQAQLSERKFIKTSTHFQKRTNKRNQLFFQRYMHMKHHLCHHLKIPAQILMWSRRKAKRNQSFILCRNNCSMMVKAIGYISNTNSLNMQNHQIGRLRNV